MTSRIIPAMRYADAPTMIGWLCDTFGFTRHLIVEDGAGGIAHAQLSFGNAMIMLGTARDDAFGKLQRVPAALGGTTQSCYVVVAEVDTVCERARAAGAEIILEPQDQEYGGRLFTCRDPEGHLWNFGSYDPWAAAH